MIWEDRRRPDQIRAEGRGNENLEEACAWEKKCYRPAGRRTTGG